ncbi:MAG: glycosyltransferase family 4 protein [bacterium]|nr:glycosyltransferase family 4 protein [bacterium]
MKKLRIAQIAPLWLTVPPKKYGGIERVVAFLCDELVKMGHQVTLFAAPGSKTKAKLVSVFPTPLLEAGMSWNNPMWNLRNLSKAYEVVNNGPFDIVHTHLDIWSLFFNNLSKVPTVLTMHNPLRRNNADANLNDRVRLFSEESRKLNMVFISQSAQKLAGIKFPKARVVYNGINLDHFKFHPKGGSHYVWIARVNKHKGIENAIAAAEKTGNKLLLAGRLDPSQRQYFNEKIKPRLNSRIKYVGELSEAQLSDFYGPAKALLYPIEWEEPFGLVVTESMACGTPVIAYRRGSMPELITHGQNGFVVDNMKQMLAAMKKIDSIDRQAVRKQVEDNFSKEIMARSYEKLYYDILSR